MIQFYISWEGEAGYDENWNKNTLNKTNNPGLAFY